MISEQAIPCPVCQTKIQFDARALVQGHKFSCSNCGAVVGISQEAIKEAGDAFNTYEELKRKAISGKKK